jgi:hypothetical protein
VAREKSRGCVAARRAGVNRERGARIRARGELKEPAMERSRRRGRRELEADPTAFDEEDNGDFLFFFQGKARKKPAGILDRRKAVPIGSADDWNTCRKPEAWREMETELDSELWPTPWTREIRAEQAHGKGRQGRAVAMEKHRAASEREEDEGERGSRGTRLGKNQTGGGHTVSPVARHGWSSWARRAQDLEQGAGTLGRTRLGQGGAARVGELAGE